MARRCPFFTGAPGSAMIFETTPSRCAATSTSSSTIIGPEARNSGTDGVFAVLVSTRAAGIADSEAATVAGGDAGALEQAMPAVSHNAIAVVIPIFVI